jgi:allophanate hydrolase
LQLSKRIAIDALRAAYADKTLTPAAVMADIRQRSQQLAEYNIWIHLLSPAEQQPYLDALADKPMEACPLWGIPFAIKDNIDLAGIATTAGCEAFRYIPSVSAQVVQQLIDAGAIPVGKANLDQFATGLNGTRSPWGACKNAFDPHYISGGSSSGSAVSVALGLASFSLGTDTAGSGRVPACFNNLIGVKPSRGLLSTTGLVPACRSLDCISIFALNSSDANQVLACAEGDDPADGYCRANPYDNQARHYGLRQGAIRVGIIPRAQLKFFGDEAYAQAYQQTLDTLAADGMELVDIDYRPFDEAARLLYEGPWVSERYLAIQSFIEEQPEALLPVIRSIVEPGGEPLAIDLFRAQYRLEALKKQCSRQLQSLDCLLTPTAGRLFTIKEMQAEPILRNSELGYYTNFMNLLNLASVAVPSAFTGKGLPFGVTLVGPAFSDRSLLSIANRIEQVCPLSPGLEERLMSLPAAKPVGGSRSIKVAVCGAHLEGLSLNWQLQERGGVLSETTTTAQAYRLYTLAGGPPFRPALIRDTDEGSNIAVEVWTLPLREFGSFVANIPAPLGIGKLELADGRWVSGFICEPCGIEGAEEVSHLGGWRRYLA